MNFVRTAGVMGSVAASLTMAVTGALPVHAATLTYSGRAYAVGVSNATLLGQPVGDTTVADTGQLPSGGPSVTNGPGTFTVPGLGTATVVLEQANGSGGVAAASSNVASVDLSPGGTALLAATVLKANTRVTCDSHTAISSVATLSIGGHNVPVPVNPAPNTTVTVGGMGGSPVIATVTFNAQSYNPLTNEESASAVVITFPTDGALKALFTGTITLSHAESDLLGCSTATASAPTPTAAAPKLPVPAAGSSVGAEPIIPIGLVVVGLGMVLGMVRMGRHRRPS